MPGEAKETSFDYTIPPSLHTLLSYPLPQALDSLVPTTRNRSSSGRSTGSSIRAALAQTSLLGSLFQSADTTAINGGGAYLSSGVALVDLFFAYSPGVAHAKLVNLLDKAWSDDATATLKIIFHGRSIHEGKCFKEEFYFALGWLFDKHPRTLLDNLHILVEPTCKLYRSKERVEAKARRLASLGENGGGVAPSPLDEEHPARPHGTFKDLIDLLMLYLHDQLTVRSGGNTSALKESISPANDGKRFAQARKEGSFKKGAGKPKGLFAKTNSELKVRRDKIVRSNRQTPYNKQTSQEEESMNGSSIAKALEFQLQVRNAGNNKRRHELFHNRLHQLLIKDARFRGLYLTVVSCFKDALKRDLNLLQLHREFIRLPVAKKGAYIGADASPYIFDISFAAKWVPTPAHGADRQLHFASALAIALFAPEGELSKSQVGKLRQRLQKEVLTPLRAATKVPEVKMGNAGWKIDYSKVPARAMSRNMLNFMKHDPVGFEAYLTKVVTGRYQIAGASLAPHEILIDAMSNNETVVRVAELQWKSLVASIKDSSRGLFGSTIAVADVSGSMGVFNAQLGKTKPHPIGPCIALTLLLADLAAEPWNGSFITFSSDPVLQWQRPTDSLAERISSMSKSHWEMNTDFAKVFRLLLDKAKSVTLAPEQMVKRVFVFSDMQFDQATGGTQGETVLDTIRREFHAAGYSLPELVYWNLAGETQSTPSRATINGVTMVSGFSGALMKHYLGLEGVGGEGDGDSDDDGYVAVGMPGEYTVKEVTGEEENALSKVLKIISADSFKDLVVRD